MAAALSVEIFRLTDLPPLNHRRGLCDQMQRSGVSIPSNIAEGEERGSNKDSLRFLFIAKGSLAELRTQMDIAHSIGDLPTSDYEALEVLADKVARLLSGMIKRRVSLEKAQRA